MLPLKKAATRSRVRRPVGRCVVGGTLFVVLAFVFLASAAGEGYGEGVDLGDSKAEVLAKVCPGPDSCYYLAAGQELLEGDLLTPENHWILNLWPPGGAVVSSLYLVVGKSGVPLPLVVGLFAITAWTAVLYLWFQFLYSRVGFGLATGAVLMVALGQPMRKWYLAEGLFYADSVSVILFLGALLALLVPRGENVRNFRRGGAAAGLLLAAAAYVRVPFELAALVLSLAAALLAGFELLRSFLRGPRRLRPRIVGQSRLSPSAHALLACVVVFHLATIPWRFVAAEVVRPGDFRWSVASVCCWYPGWMPSEYLYAQGSGWLVEGTFNTPCRVEPDRCADIFAAEVASGTPYAGLVHTNGEFASLTMDALAHHPIRWTEIKLKAAARFWFDAEEVETLQLLENGMLLVLLFFVAAGGSRRLGALGVGAYLLVLAAAIAALGPGYIFHFEERYFFPLKSAIPLLGVLVFPWERLTSLQHRLVPPSGEARERKS